jgi:ribonuclease HI
VTNRNVDPSRHVRIAKPNVTIFADASHDRSARVAGWGAWIKADGRQSITGGAAMKAPVMSSGEAELCALANALALARSRGAVARGDVVMLQSDSLNALAIIRGKIDGVADRPAAGGLAVAAVKKMKLSELHSAAVGVIGEIVATLDVALVTRHVRGHRKGGGRQWVNAEVDRIARRAMRERRGPRTPTIQAANAPKPGRSRPTKSSAKKPSKTHD